jgi:hypothetical protein
LTVISKDANYADGKEDEDESAEVSASVPRLIATDQNAVQVNLGELTI